VIIAGTIRTEAAEGAIAPAASTYLIIAAT
jgi:hypothetical protein